MKKMLVLVSVFMVLVVGCQSSKFSMNYQKSLARCAGDLGTTATLESGKVDVPTMVATIEKIQKAINDLNVENMSRADLVAKLEEAIQNENLKKYATKLVALIPEDLDLQAGKKIMFQATKGMMVATQEWSELDKIKKGEEVPNE